MFNVFFVHKSSGAILYEVIDTDTIFHPQMFKYVHVFKHIMKYGKYIDFMDFLYTYNITTRSIIYRLSTFFHSPLKYFTFQFVFGFEFYPDVTLSFKDKLKFFWYKLLLNGILLFL